MPTCFLYGVKLLPSPNGLFMYSVCKSKSYHIVFKDLQDAGRILAACEPFALRAIASWQPSIKPLMDFKALGHRTRWSLAGLKIAPPYFFLS